MSNSPTPFVASEANRPRTDVPAGSQSPSANPTHAAAASQPRPSAHSPGLQPSSSSGQPDKAGRLPDKALVQSDNAATATPALTSSSPALTSSSPALTSSSPALTSSSSALQSESSPLSSARRLSLRTTAQQLFFFFARLLASALAIALLGSLLISQMPAVDWSQDEMDTRWSAEHLQAIRQEGIRYKSPGQVFVAWVTGVLAGDLGTSRSLQIPVVKALAERSRTTLQNTFVGVAVGWSVALVLAALASSLARGWASGLLRATSQVGLSLPAAVVALAGVYWQWPPGLCIAVALAPRVFVTMLPVMEQAWKSPATRQARAFGVGLPQIAYSYVWIPCRRILLSHFALCWPMAFGVSIPVEVLCGAPGLGQLAWSAAQSRDVPLLMNLAILTMLITQVLSEALGENRRVEAARLSQTARPLRPSAEVSPA